MNINRPATNLVSITGRFLFGLILIVLVATIALPAIVSAVDYPKLVNRSLNVGDVSPGAVTNYSISFRYPNPTTIGSIRFLLCTTPIIEDPCVNPSADMQSATLDSQSGVTGFSIFSQTDEEIIISRTPGAASTVQSTYNFNDITNPSGLQAPFFIRIMTYTSADASGAFNFASSVVNATTEPIVINTEVPPILYFCAAITITEYCNSATGDFIDYGGLSDVVTDVGQSQFGVATNAIGGYVVTANGSTLTSGNRLISAISSPTNSVVGTEQFGLNLRANTSPPFGQDVSGVGIGVVTPDYDTPDLFKFEDGDVVATAATGTLFNTYTVTYVVNIPEDQASGVYNTTIAYICTAAF